MKRRSCKAGDDVMTMKLMPTMDPLLHSEIRVCFSAASSRWKACEAVVPCRHLQCRIGMERAGR